jgi:phosphoribosylaminoimidazolecarboxamide formyltransferase/IMP cyclohydrolase
VRVQRALLSVSDKTNIVDFARGLAELDIEIVSTGGTASLLRSAGLRVVDVSAVTDFPEILGGRLKTIHPRIHGGIQHDRANDEERAALEQHEIQNIDLICANLLPFEATAARADVSKEDVLDQVDVGGSALLRAAARNHAHVVVVSSPRRYGDVLDALRAGSGSIDAALRLELAKSAFRLTAQYDAGIANYLAEQHDQLFPSFYAPFFEKVRDLRYGENPFQRAALYSQRGSGGPSLAGAEVLWGKELSFNNCVDLDAALRIVREFSQPMCVVVKHGNPAGCAVNETPLEAFGRAHAADPDAAFGCVLGFNRVVDVETAKAIASPDNFVECVLAPGFDPQALSALTSGAKWGKSVRLLKVEGLDQPLGPRDRDVRRVLGGVLVQEYDLRGVPNEGVRSVSERNPDEGEMRDLEFAWMVAKHVRTNAVVVAKDRAVVSVGPGQLSRVDAVRVAMQKAGDRAQGAVLACDAFIPFPDSVEAAVAAGIVAIVEPGGSRNDHEIIDAANAAGAALVFTGMRHFRQG